MITTAFNATKTGSVQRTQKDGSMLQVSCPEVIFEYSQRMGGVDRFDERRGRYSISRRCRRWWMRILYFLIDSCIVNAYILFQSVHPQDCLSILEFRLQLFRCLVAGYSSRIRQSSLQGSSWVRRRSSHKVQKPLGVPNDVRLKSVGVHFPDKMSSFKRCRVCSSRTNNKRSRIRCSVCDVALCIVPCFAQFHKCQVAQ